MTREFPPLNQRRSRHRKREYCTLSPNPPKKPKISGSTPQHIQAGLDSVMIHAPMASNSHGETRYAINGTGSVAEEVPFRIPGLDLASATLYGSSDTHALPPSTQTQPIVQTETETTCAEQTSAEHALQTLRNHLQNQGIPSASQTNSQPESKPPSDANIQLIEKEDEIRALRNELSIGQDQNRILLDRISVLEDVVSRTILKLQQSITR
jgi:hypothetical protein